MPKSSLDALGGEYDVVSLRFSWGGLSLFLFLLTMPAPYLLRLQPWRPQAIWMTPLVPVAVVGILALLGLIAGLIGWKVSPSRGLAKIGLLLNGAVVGCIALVIFGMITIFYLR